MIKTIVNKSACLKLAPFVIKPYQLSKEGGDFVIQSNKNLPESYFEHLQFPVSDFWRNYFEEKINILKPKSKGLALDVCCGTGTLCLNIMPNSGFSRCIAIDNSKYAIQILRNRIKGDQHIEANNLDITDTSFDEGAIDAVYGNSFLHHIPDNYAFLSEMYRILRKGGVVVLTGEPSIAAEFLESFIQMNVRKLFEILRLKKKKINHRDPPVTDIWLYEEKLLREMLVEIGFKDIRIIGFGMLVTLFNGPTSWIFGRLTGKTMQPDWYWRLFGWLCGSFG